MGRSRRLLVLGIWLCIAFLAGPLAAGAKLDKGLLDTSWFGEVDEFRESERFDYVWVKEGFSLRQTKLHILDWEKPQFLGKERDGKDSARAFELTERMPSLIAGALANALGDDAEISRSEGEIEVVGRFVDVNAGSKAAKWIVGMGAGSAAATWDLKFVDKATGELLIAVHHRSISGTNMSDIDDKIVKWLDEGLADAVKTGLADDYASGKKRKK